MKKNGLFKAFSILCAAALIAAAGLSLGRAFGLGGFTPALAESYAAGDAEITRPVKSIEIDWTSGKVTILYHAQNTVLISEKSGSPLTENERMQWRLEGDTLRIRYEKPGFRLFSYHQKELTVTLPEDVILENARVSVTSGTIEIPFLNAENLTLNATSGEIIAAAHARNIKGGCTSGSVDLRIAGAAEAVDLSATSGGISLEGENIGQTRLGATSGSVYAAVKNTEQFKAASTSGLIQAILGQVKQAEIGSTSGDLDVKIVQFDALKIHCTSGDVKLTLPEDRGFTARFDTTGGDVEYRLPLEKRGKTYVLGDGSADLKISTTSGDIALLPWTD